MTERENEILNGFADWCEGMEQGWINRFENPSVWAEQKLYESRAIEALRTLRNQDYSGGFSQHSELEKAFRISAVEYFVRRFQFAPTDLCLTALFLLEEFEKDWAKAETWFKANATNVSDFLEIVTYDVPIKVREVAQTGIMLGLTYIPKLFESALNIAKQIEYEARFGADEVFRELGQMFAEDYFQNKITRGRPRGGGNIDAVRAFQFSRLVKGINSRLRAQGFRATTLKEVCEITFGDDRLLDEYSRKNQIKWALDNYFRVRNISVRAFLNSISRGKKWLIARGDSPKVFQIHE